MNDILSFRKLLTPTLIQILFWIGVGVCAIEGISMIASAARFGVGVGIVNGLLVLIIGPVAVRVLCELIMAIFGIHQALRDRGDI